MKEVDDYDPVEHRPPEQRTTSTFAVFMHLLKAAIGSGVLFLPHAFKNAGYVSALICSFFIGSISTYTAVLMVQCSQMLCRKTRVPSLNFAETAETSFKVGPEPLRKYASLFGKTTNVIVCFVQYETTVVYALYVATSFKQVIEYFSGEILDVRFYLLALLPILLLFSLVPNFSYLTPFSVVGAIFLFFGICSTLYYLLSDFQSPSRLDSFTDIEQAAAFCCVFLYAVHNMSMIMPLENSMREPKNMCWVLIATMILNIAENVIFGFLGYNKYIDACDTVIKNLPLDEGLAQAVKITITLSVLLTYALQYYIPVVILWPMIAAKVGDKPMYEKMFRLGGVTISTLLAIALPHMSSLLGLFAALSMTTVMLLIPITIEIATRWYEPKSRSRYFMFWKNGFIAVIWLVLLIMGTVRNIGEIVDEYSKNETTVSIFCVD